MIRLIQIEWIKLKNSRSFRILILIWVLAFISVPIGLNSFINWLESTGVEGSQLLSIKPSDFPIFDFEDIWQNLAYLYKTTTILLCFVIIVNVCNEFDFKTIRQNVIDGLSKREFIISKLLLITAISLVATLMLFILGLIAGYAYSPVKDAQHIFMNIEFVGAYFLHLIYHLSFSLLLAILLKRSGIIIALLIFYSTLIEPIGSSIMQEVLKVPRLTDFLPLNVSWNLIPRPIEKYFLFEVQDYVGMDDVGIAIGYIFIFIMSSYLLIAKRDLH